MGRCLQRSSSPKIFISDFVVSYNEEERYTGFGYMTDDELQAQLSTKEGISKLHRQFWHLQSAELFRRVSSAVPKEKHAELNGPRWTDKTSEPAWGKGHGVGGGGYS